MNLDNCIYLVSILKRFSYYSICLRISKVELKSLHCYVNYFGRIHILAKKSFWPTFLQRILIEGAFFIYPKVFSSDEEMSGYKKLPKTKYTMLYQFQMLFEEDILDLFTFLYLVFHLKLYKERKSLCIDNLL